jgi:mRNA interferase MazF
LELANTPLPKRTWAKISQVRTLSTQRLAGRITACNPAELQQVVEGLNEILGKS